MKKQSIIIVMAAAVFLFAAGTVLAGFLDRVVDIAEDAVKKDQPQQGGTTQSSTSGGPSQQGGTQSSPAVLTDNTVYPVNSDEGVVINGVKWATRNVDVPGKFTANPSDAGKFYQWNRKKAWPITSEAAGWDESVPRGETWAKANDPSPAGWRVPTQEELQKLLDYNKVKCEWTTLNGVKGTRLTDKVTGNSIFLPAPGHLGRIKAPLVRVGMDGYFWSSTETGKPSAYGLSINGGACVEWAGVNKAEGNSIRAVAE